MSQIIRCLLVLMLCGSFVSRAQSLDRKGRVIRKVDVPMTMKYGAPAPIPHVSLRIKSTEKGTLLLAEEREEKDAAKPRTRYLAYDATGKSSEVRFVDEPDLSCHWAIREGKDQTRYLSLLDVKHFKIPAGPLVEWELRQQDGKLFVAKPDSEAYKHSQWVGTFVEYDNLDDGK